MRKNVLAKTYYFLLILLFSLEIHAQQTPPSYDITCGGQGKAGTYLVKVTAQVKNTEEGMETLKRCAVHGVMFRGFTGEAVGCTTQKPLIRDPQTEQTQEAFFTHFFNENTYRNYVSPVEASFVSSKLKRKLYEVAALFIVDKERLLHYLEENDIVKGFSDFW